MRIINVAEAKAFFSHKDIPNPSENQEKICEDDLTKNHLCDSLESI